MKKLSAEAKTKMEQARWALYAHVVIAEKSKLTEPVLDALLAIETVMQINNTVEELNEKTE